MSSSPRAGSLAYAGDEAFAAACCASDIDGCSSADPLNAAAPRRKARRSAKALRRMAPPPWGRILRVAGMLRRVAAAVATALNARRSAPGADLQAIRIGRRLLIHVKGLFSPAGTLGSSNQGSEVMS